MTNDKQRERLIPKEVVLADMYTGDGIVSSAARDYYRLHYATDDERTAMDRQDKLTSVGAMMIYGILVVLLAICIIQEGFIW